MRARSVRFPAPCEIEIVAAEVAAPGSGELPSVFFRYVQDGRMDLSALLTDRVAPDAAVELYRSLERDRRAKLGVLIDWDSGR